MILEVVSPLTEAYSFDFIRSDPLHMVISRGNKRNFHQDKVTGNNINRVIE